ncbi:MAG: bifunctional adenosylcobinamide kinase/adenosylcobinamide-phosphate guanylyltransferase [Clostridia bacterium]|nr:bifunctional adenosylcobinamide kinase/adenosylcobinamide-phosphate guanylyltransferase [Clostridia bacterium]
MRLYIGGAYQGQLELARSENPGAPVIEDFHERVREALLRGEDALAFARRVCEEQPEAVVVANEVGCGIVPMDAGERAYREAAGRALCELARQAKTVTRVVCGIGVRIK